MPLVRLRRLQAVLRLLQADALVGIVGLDSGFDDEQYQLFDYLFPGVRAAHPSLDNIVLVVKQQAIHVIVDASTRLVMAPLLACVCLARAVGMCSTGCASQGPAGIGLVLPARYASGRRSCRHGRLTPRFAQTRRTPTRTWPRTFACAPSLRCSSPATPCGAFFLAGCDVRPPWVHVCGARDRWP